MRRAKATLTLIVSLFVSLSTQNVYALNDASKPGTILAEKTSQASGAGETQSPEQKKSQELNDKGVSELKEKNYAAAIKSFRSALDLNAHCEAAKKSLIEAYNLYGLSLSADPKKAIVQFHGALNLDKGDVSAKRGIDQAIKAMGLNPRSADARIKLADQAQVDNDREGVGLEMEAADYLRGHPNQDVVYGDEAKSKK